MTEPIHIRVTTQQGSWQIQTMYSWGLGGVQFPDRRSATAVARGLSFALRENGVQQAPVLTLTDASATWLMDLAQEEIESTEVMLLDEQRSVDRSIRLNYEWLAELDSLNADNGRLELDFGQACAVVDLLHEYLDADGDPEELAYSTLFRLRNVEIDISVYYSKNSYPGYHYELCRDGGGTWYDVYDPDDHLIASVDTRPEAWSAVRRHHGPPVGTQLQLEDQ